MEKTNSFDFVRNKKILWIVLIVLAVVAAASFIIRGFNIDIDFAGGAEMTISLDKQITSDDLDKVSEITKKSLTDATNFSSVSKSSADNTKVIIKTNEISVTDQDKIFEAVKEEYGLNSDAPDEIQKVSQKISGSTTKVAILATLAAVALMLVYIAFRFQFASAIAAIIALVFNLFVMIVSYSLFQVPINSNIIAAMLTILGYSINATIIIFDRVREDRERNPEESFESSVNKAVHQTLMRTINTTITTLLTIGMVYILGVESIRNFALPLIVGILAGVFSSIFMAGQLWAWLRTVLFSKNKKKDIKSSGNKSDAKA